MSSSLTPFGLRPISHQGGQARSRGYQNGIVSGYATALYQGTPIKLVTSTYNTWALAVAVTANEIGGVFQGVEYTDSNGRRQYSKYWPASLAPLTGTNWTVWVWDDPDTIFEIQANGALGEVAGRGMAGAGIDLIAGAGTGGIGVGSATTQLSSCAADASSIQTATNSLQLRVIDKARYVDNDWGDTYPILQVQINLHQQRSAHIAV